MWSTATRCSLMVRSGPTERVSNHGRKHIEVLLAGANLL